MALQLHPYNSHARVTAKIDRNAHSKEIVWKKTWCIKQQLPQKQQRKLISDSPQISKNGIETIKHPSGTAAKETRPSYPNTSGTSKSFHVKWRILRSCQPYSNVSKKCNPCLQENIGVNRSCVNSSFVFYYLLLAWRNHLLNIWCFCDYICILNCRVLPGLASRNRLPKCDPSWT